jgi:hypothetical protein
MHVFVFESRVSGFTDSKQFWEWLKLGYKHILYWIYSHNVDAYKVISEAVPQPWLTMQGNLSNVQAVCCLCRRPHNGCVIGFDTRIH